MFTALLPRLLDGLLLYGLVRSRTGCLSPGGRAGASGGFLSLAFLFGAEPFEGTVLDFARLVCDARQLPEDVGPGTFLEEFLTLAFLFLGVFLLAACQFCPGGFLYFRLALQVVLRSGLSWCGYGLRQSRGVDGFSGSMGGLGRCCGGLWAQELFGALVRSLRSWSFCARSLTRWAALVGSGSGMGMMSKLFAAAWFAGPSRAPVGAGVVVTGTAAGDTAVRAGVAAAASAAGSGAPAVTGTGLLVPPGPGWVPSGRVVPCCSGVGWPVSVSGSGVVPVILSAAVCASTVRCWVGESRTRSARWRRYAAATFWPSVRPRLSCSARAVAAAVWRELFGRGRCLAGLGRVFVDPRDGGRGLVAGLWLSVFFVPVGVRDRFGVGAEDVVGFAEHGDLYGRVLPFGTAGPV
ncbi:hypothetical protein J2Y41_004657 [Arthrobacter sp. 1088]|uniref:hypothetical protein n=1 Tax=Arthrobacter sp. 1088 TaxID=2817768 RepID=UPI00285E4792|nr:hypothetical protein [Arthrobacter sp. 1088]MDR6689053.1 hypothetical protein [Arthrobacter sp. 1088]